VIRIFVIIEYTHGIYYEMKLVCEENTEEPIIFETGEDAEDYAKYKIPFNHQIIEIEF